MMFRQIQAAFNLMMATIPMMVKFLMVLTPPEGFGVGTNLLVILVQLLGSTLVSEATLLMMEKP